MFLLSNIFNDAYSNIVQQRPGCFDPKQRLIQKHTENLYEIDVYTPQESTTAVDPRIFLHLQGGVPG